MGLLARGGYGGWPVGAALAHPRGGPDNSRVSVALRSGPAVSHRTARDGLRRAEGRLDRSRDGSGRGRSGPNCRQSRRLTAGPGERFQIDPGRGFAYPLLVPVIPPPRFAVPDLSRIGSSVPFGALVAWAGWDGFAELARAIGVGERILQTYGQGKSPTLPMGWHAWRLSRALGVHRDEVIASIRESRRRYVESIGPQMAALERERQAERDAKRARRWDAPGRE